MAEEIRPYQLVEIHSQAKSSRVNSWLFSLLAVSCGISGFGFWFSNAPFKDQAAVTCFGGTLFLASRERAIAFHSKPALSRPTNEVH